MPEITIELENKKKITERIIKRSKKLCKQNGIDIYKIPLIKSMNPKSTFERLTFGNANQHRKDHRTILVFGSSKGCSQAKFINGVINYVFGVEEKDKFRFQLIEEEETAQLHITRIYKINHVKGFRIPFSLTIVALPIYGTNVDDSELFRYQKTANFFLKLLKDDNGIQELDMICNIIIEDGIFNQSNLSIFGNDVADRINYWHHRDHMSSSELGKFIRQCCTSLVNIKKTKSLSLTKEVLNIRKQMETKIKELQILIDICQGKMEEIEKAKQMLEFCETHIESNDNEEENISVQLMEKVELPHGMYVKNCNRCCVTCYIPFLCLKEENSKGYRSISPDLYKMSKTGPCSVCPDKCNMSMHSNQPFRWVFVKKETQILSGQINHKLEAEIKWKDLKSKGRSLIEVLQSDLFKNREILLDHFQTSWRFIRRLNTIALYGNSFLTQKVFNFLFDAEQQLKKQGFLKDVKVLK